MRAAGSQARGMAVNVAKNQERGCTDGPVVSLEGLGSQPEILCCLFVLFVWIIPELLYFAPCVWREVITPGSGCTRTYTRWNLLVSLFAGISSHSEDRLLHFK